MMERIYSDDWRAWQDPDIPEMFNPTELVLDNKIAGGLGSKTAVVVDDQTFSYCEVLSAASTAAAALLAHGARTDERILFFGTDSFAWVATWFGAVRAGIVPAVISDLYKAHQLNYFLTDTAATVLFIDAAQFSKLADAGADLPRTLRTVIVNGHPEGGTALQADWITVSTYSDFIAGQPDSFTPTPRHRNDVTYMFYSGGTTGTAKGITHLAHDFYLVPSRHGAWWDYSQDDVVLATSKKYFTHGLWPGLLVPMYHGATAVLTNSPPRPDVVTHLVETYKPTKLITVPTVIKMLLAHFEQMDRDPDFSSLKAVYSASEKMPPEIFERWQDLFGVELMDSIGSSEVTYEWIANRPKEFRRGSLGKPIYGVEIRLVDPDGHDVNEPNTPGECWVKSQTACFFYWRKFDQTKDTFQGPWVRTGDQLQFDEDGFFWFVGRANDVFKVSGLWVSPIEVEAAITQHEDVLEAAVIGVEGDDGLTKPAAYVVLNPGKGPREGLVEELKEAVRKIAGGYKVPQQIEFVEELPRTTLQKIDRRALRDAFEAK